jgi:hypothetical protein
MIVLVHCSKRSLKIAMVTRGYFKLLFVSWKANEDKEIHSDGWLSRCSKVFVMV